MTVIIRPVFHLIIYAPVKQEVMFYYLSVHNHSGELKNVQYKK